MKIGALLVSVALACALSACDRNAPPADNLPTTAGTDAKPADATAATPVAAPAPTDVSFSVEPGVVYNCEGRDRTTSLVKWDVTRPGINEIKVQVIGPGDPEKKTLAVMSPKGEAPTGNWVAKGVIFTLVNSENGDELAKYTVTSLPCE